jgi:hypothetical protein
MRTIAVEEHFVSPAFLEGPGKDFPDSSETEGAAAHGFTSSFRISAATPRWMWPASTCRWVEQLEAADQLSIAVGSNDFLAEAVIKSDAVRRLCSSIADRRARRGRGARPPGLPAYKEIGFAGSQRCISAQPRG